MILTVTILATLIIIIKVKSKGHKENKDIDLKEEDFSIVGNSTANTITPERITTAPKDIYMCYKTKDVPPYVVGNWVKLNPDHNVQVYSDKDCEEFLLREFGQTHADLFKSIPDGPIRADFWRVCIIYARGGVYTDADVEPLVSIKDFVDQDASLVTCMNIIYDKGMNPHFIVAVPKHPLLQLCIDDYLKKFEEKDEYSYWGWSIADVMLKAMRKYVLNFKRREGLQKCIDGSNIQILEEITFEDDHVRDHIKYNEAKILNNRYGSYYEHKFN